MKGTLNSDAQRTQGPKQKTKRSKGSAVGQVSKGRPILLGGGSRKFKPLSLFKQVTLTPRTYLENPSLALFGPARSGPAGQNPRRQFG